MKAIKFKYWKDDDWWIGHLEEYPDYMTQGKTLNELKENLLSLHKDLLSEEIPSIRKIGEIQVA